MDEFIKVGKFITTHGIKGELKLLPYNDDLSRYKDYYEIYVGDKYEKEIIKSVRFHKQSVLIKLNGYDDINEVLKLKGEDVYIHKDNLLELSKDEYFIKDLIGLEVYDLENNKVGILKEILKGLGNDIYVVKNKQKEFLIPGVKKFIKEINIDENKIIIAPIEGMIE